ncbi:hypothetical protein [Amycolatopsis sp. NPDC051128]|uniref:hypothetical protein n=1 Tax=Amycolatopsis sp. NPDC051128 TaxID=3155412 RepID=UPI00342033F1
MDVTSWLAVEHWVVAVSDQLWVRLLAILGAVILLIQIFKQAARFVRWVGRVVRRVRRLVRVGVRALSRWIERHEQDCE